MKGSFGIKGGLVGPLLLPRVGSIPPLRATQRAWSGRLLLCISRRSRLTARRATSPEDDLSFIDFETMIIVCEEAGRGPKRAVDIEGLAAASADQVMMIVAHSIFVSGRRSRRLDSAEEVFLDQDAECAVDGLARDGSDDRPHVVDQLVGRGMGARRHPSHDGQPLSRHLQTVSAKKLFDIALHGGHRIMNSRLSQILDRVYNRVLTLGDPHRCIAAEHLGFRFLGAAQLREVDADELGASHPEKPARRTQQRRVHHHRPCVRRHRHQRHGIAQRLFP